MIERVEVTPGPGTVIRYGGIVVWADTSASAALISFLTQSARNLSDSVRGGRQIADHIAGVLADRDPEPGVAFAVIGPSDHGWSTLLHGPVQLWDGARWLAPSPAPGWLQAIVTAQPAITVSRAGAHTPGLNPDSMLDLEAGVVPAGGFVLVPAAPPEAPAADEPATRPAVVAPVEAGPAVVAPVEAGPADAGPVEAGPIEGGPVGTGPVETGSGEGGSVGTGPVHAGPGEGGPVEAGPATAGAPGAETTSNPQLHGEDTTVLPTLPETGGAAGSGGPVGAPGTEEAVTRVMGLGPPTTVIGRMEDPAGPGIVPGTAADRGEAPDAGATGATPVPATGDEEAAADTTGTDTTGTDTTGTDTTGAVGDPAPAVSRRHGGPVMDLRAVPDAAPNPLPVGVGPDQPVPGSPVVAGTLCPRGHLNRAGMRRCVRCATAISPDAARNVSGGRPPLGILIADDGALYRLDSPYLVGSDPGRDPTVSGGRARPLTLTGERVSTSHAEVRLDGWDVSVVDRGSSGGTYVCEAGSRDWQRIKPFEPATLRPGTHVAFAQRIVTFATAWIPEDGTPG